MRFISAQLIALLTDDLYLRNAGHANAMAQRLAEGVRDLPGLTIPLPVQANGVFPILPREVSERLMEKFRFYFWDEATVNERLEKIMVKAFDEVSAMAEKHRVSTRIGAYMLSIDRVAAMHRMRGLYA